MATQQPKRRDARIEQALAEIVRRLVDEYQPEKVILFGSYAYGEPHEGSDLDVLIIKETPEHRIDRMRRVLQLADGAHRHIAFEPIVLTPHELEQRLEIGDQFVAEIVEKGELLYAA
jgi:predicted nucleotidyltransferase